MNKMEFIDLGLSSGLKWSKCNVGAETEIDYGYYFQWGDIVDKSNTDCNWENYKYYGGPYNITKYTNFKYSENPDNKLILCPEDDAATQVMGEHWRMPTIIDFQELFSNTTNEWIANYNNSGVNGRKFTSRINGNSIFFPAAGDSVDNEGRYGYVWSSSLYTGTHYTAWSLNFSDVVCGMFYRERFYAWSVRGVL